MNDTIVPELSFTCLVSVSEAVGPELLWVPCHILQCLWALVYVPGCSVFHLFGGHCHREWCLWPIRGSLQGMSSLSCLSFYVRSMRSLSTLGVYVQSCVYSKFLWVSIRDSEVSKYFWVLRLGPGFSASAPLTFWATKFFVLQGIVGCCVILLGLHITN